VAQALAESKLVTIASDGRGAPDAAANNIIGVIQTVLAAQLVGKSGLLDGAASPPPAPAKPVAPEGGPTRR
jgi:flotillin